MKIPFIGEGLFQLNWRDLAKGLIVTILFSIAMAVKNAVTDCPTCTPPNVAHVPAIAELITAAKVAWLAGIAYLVKQFFTDYENKFLKKI
jgi:hypothetical protein